MFGQTGSPDDGTEADRRFAVILPSEPWAAGAIGAELHEWLEVLGWPSEQRSAIVSATLEAVVNAIRHAYPPVELGGGGVLEVGGSVRVDARVLAVDGRRRTRVLVEDEGTWDPLGMIHSEGAGLRRMTELMDEVDVRQSELGVSVDAVGTDRAGTQVTLLSPPAADR
ncbi:ATP-binding protein [Pseudonocardia lutea]|jgi:anti-sigma regulatory factor (Ser/Thr protein kinase)|uniref:ATP-binding protein n=1 Tax=Pseudonocardia lutea TaxID=2172015 RepID=A0ABW1I6Y1_9PSEU